MCKEKLNEINYKILKTELLFLVLYQSIRCIEAERGINPEHTYIFKLIYKKFREISNMF